MNFMYLCDASTEAAKSAMRKIAEQSQPGAMIALTTDEYNEVQNYFKLINLDQESSSVIEIDPEKHYLLFADPQKVHLGDIEKAQDLGYKINIIRTNET